MAQLIKMAGLQLSTPNNTQEIGQALNRYSVSQLIAYFAKDLPPASNYPRHAKAYVIYCLKNSFSIDGFSYSRYTAELPPNRVSPIRRFLLFYQKMGSPLILPDPKRVSISPAANDLILRFIRDAKNLRGDQSKDTYTKALNAFFLFMDSQVQAGQSASLSGRTVSDFVDQLKANAYSAFTINLYLSAIKQLSAWCVRKRAELTLDDTQLNALRDIDAVRGLAIERTFYKDSLDSDERDQLLTGIESARDGAILALLSLEGLRTVEVTRLRLGDIDFDRRQLKVLGKGRYTKKAIKLFGSCSVFLQAYLEEKGQWPIAASQHARFVFEDLKTYQIRYIVDKYLRQLGLKREGMSAHSLRHTVGQLLLENGVSLEHVQQHLRHETIETTQFYTKKQTMKSYLQQMPD
ncbi:MULTISPECIES: tyrosine-type recombinase/integrase [Spirosoma]|uniref:Site-specific integrase n=1 Tax=Spirosoma liriopis TaxID=2937440 RepID=A0ABT0HUA5_9BACT|nr:MULTISPECIES: tyrosine-type recombinase/integrase [Spirosoma]MCK8495565.1 site-specific integrase [Spirosoma liriopis]UHG94583.1 site-specific integrase [Spirosoma oryzicola]